MVRTMSLIRENRDALRRVLLLSVEVGSFAFLLFNVDSWSIPMLSVGMVVATIVALSLHRWFFKSQLWLAAGAGAILMLLTGFEKAIVARGFGDEAAVQITIAFVVMMAFLIGLALLCMKLCKDIQVVLCAYRNNLEIVRNQQEVNDLQSAQIQLYEKRLELAKLVEGSCGGEWYIIPGTTPQSRKE